MTENVDRDFEEATPTRPPPRPVRRRSVLPRNRVALIAYYLGLAAMLPVIGIVFALPAVIAGRRGLALCRERPDWGGAAHARMGIGGGVLFGMIWLALIGRLVWEMSRG